MADRIPAVRATRAGLVFFIIAALALSCAPKAAADGGPSAPNPTLRSAVLKIGPASIEAEVADTAAQRETGLMFRKELPDGKGMLFIFESDQRLSFWMKNTSLPLSLAYISSDGRITQIVDLVPFSLDPVGSDRSVRYALEAPRGWFDRAGVKVGDKVDVPAFAEN